jgi:hypothetical protein
MRSTLRAEFWNKRLPEPMDSQAPPILGDALVLEAPPVIKAKSRWPSFLYRALCVPVKFLWGMVFCQGILGSILVVGWTYRLAQRSVWKYWWGRAQPDQRKETFVEFLDADDRTKAQVSWPNWFTQQDFRKLIRRRSGTTVGCYILSLLKGLVYSLWLNFRIGLQAIANTWVLTLPACLFWWFGWYDGWNNSFNKGYEQAPVGPLISLFGVALFIAVMFYAPLAQARQAATGEWRAFYQFRLIWSIVRLRWLSCIGLALLYSLLALPLNILKTAPGFWGNQPALGNVSDAEAIKTLSGYFFWCALWMLPAYVMLRLVAARIYASGILSLVQTGRLSMAALAESERNVLKRLNLLQVRPQPERHFFVRFVAWAGTRAGRTASAVVLVFVWFSFVAQIYITEFLNYHQAHGWLNQPLVQLPWFYYVPARLKNPIGDMIFIVLLVLLTLLIGSVARTLRSLREKSQP